MEGDSYLERLCSFDIMHHGLQFCEIILNLDQWFN